MESDYVFGSHSECHENTYIIFEEFFIHINCHNQRLRHALQPSFICRVEIISHIPPSFTLLSLHTASTIGRHIEMCLVNLLRWRWSSSFDTAESLYWEIPRLISDWEFMKRVPYNRRFTLQNCELGQNRHG